MVIGRNYWQSAVNFAKVYAPNIDWFEFEFIFAAEVFPVNAADDCPENRRASGNCDGRAIGWFENFQNYLHEGDLSCVRSLDARMLGVGSAERGLVGF